MAELIAAYSPPIPIPVRKRKRKKYQAENENAVRYRGQDEQVERDHEQLLATVTIGQLPEDQSPDAGSRDVERA